MSILASLVRAYDRLPDAPPFGSSEEKISFLISLNGDGTAASPPIDLRTDDKKRTPRLLPVPAAFKRPGVTPRPFFLWDNTAFVLGITSAEGKDAALRHKAFREYHFDVLSSTDDPGLLALVAFLRAWTPDRFVALGWPEEMKDKNVIFCLESDRLSSRFLHCRQAARSLWARLSASGDKTEAICLVTGEKAPISITHPAIKGVRDAQTAGASIVSFNADAYESYGHRQGENAPVSEGAAAAYTTVLNRYLRRGSGHNIQIGDASTVFWADASEADKAVKAETLFAEWFEGPPPDTEVDEDAQAKLVGSRLAQIKAGETLSKIPPDLAEGVRFHVLGLAPNAARLSIRFYYENDFGVLAENYRHYVEDMRIEPADPRDPHPPLWKYLAETAVLGKRENVPPNLAGDWMRAILSGTAYPLTLLSSVLMRLRLDQTVNAPRVAMLKAIIVRNFSREDTPVALQSDYPSKGYQLGRLFAVYERIQTDALGGKVNATVKDKFYGAASAQPRKVFALLERGSANHLSKIGKQSPGRKVNLEKLVGEIMGAMDPAADPFPASLSAEDQALFGLGYYHQRNDFFKSHKDDTASEETAK
jgi:CRISPR-associated protein Csd1